MALCDPPGGPWWWIRAAKPRPARTTCPGSDPGRLKLLQGGGWWLDGNFSRRQQHYLDSGEQNAIKMEFCGGRSLETTRIAMFSAKKQQWFTSFFKWWDNRTFDLVPNICISKSRLRTTFEKKMNLWPFGKGKAGCFGVQNSFSAGAIFGFGPLPTQYYDPFLVISIPKTIRGLFVKKIMKS